VPYQAPTDTGGTGTVDGLADFAVELDVSVGSDPGSSPEDANAADKNGGTEVVAPSIGVGSPCLKASDCGDGWACLNWPDGYCTMLDCVVGSCPTDSVCVPVEGGNRACLQACDAGMTCPNPAQQACKGIHLQEGDPPTLLCYGVATNAGAVGAECQDPSQCTQNAVCVALSANGYCSIMDCDGSSCPVGSTCSKLQGTYYCLRDCAGDEECVQTASNEQKCVSLKDLEKVPVQVCAPAGGEKNIGEGCVSDIECVSGSCQVLGEGRCSQTNKPCDSVADCQGAEFCNVGPQTKVGYCTGTCSINMPCPGAGFCALSGDLSTGECRAACSGAQDPTCPVDDGFVCTYGVPLGEFAGKYLCQHAVPGSVGSSCALDDECPLGTCAGAPEGYCILPCGPDFACPYPGTCFKDAAAQTSCRPTCLSAADCKPGEGCEPAMGGLTKACVGL
jgi:hypothetical protein